MNLKSEFFDFPQEEGEENLLDLGENLIKNYQLFYDNLRTINRLPDEDRSKIQEIIDNLKQDYINNSPKVQEINRVKFISSLFNDIKYKNSYNIFIFDHFSKISKSVHMIKDPNEIRNYIKKVVLKQQEKYFCLAFKLKEISTKFVIANYQISKQTYLLSPSLIMSPSHCGIESTEIKLLKKMAKVLEEKMGYNKDLLINLENVNFVSKLSEDELSNERYVIENYKQQIKENLDFLNEDEMKDLINGICNNRFMNHKIDIFSCYIDNIPQHMHFEVLNSFSDEIPKIKENLVGRHKLEIPKTLEEITNLLKNVALAAGIEADIGVDNGALLLFQIEKHFLIEFNEQKSVLEYSNFKYENIQLAEKSNASLDFNLKKNDFLLTKHNGIKRFANVGIFSQEKNNLDDLIINSHLKGQKDNLSNIWLSFLQINDIEEVERMIKHRGKEFYKKNKPELYLPEIFFEFYKGFNKLKIVNSRRKIISLLNYINYELYLLEKIGFVYEQDIDNFKNDNLRKVFDFFEISLHDSKMFKEMKKIIFNFEKPEVSDDFEITIKDSLGNKIIFDTSFDCLRVELDYLERLCGYYAYFFLFKVDKSNEKIEKNIQMDNMDRIQLIDTILNIFTNYKKEKVKFLLKLEVIMDSLISNERKNETMKKILELINKKPKIEIFNNTIIECLEIELKKFEILNDIFDNMERNQKNLENILIKAYQPDKNKEEEDELDSEDENDLIDFFFLSKLQQHNLSSHYEKFPKVFLSIDSAFSSLNASLQQLSQLDLLLIESEVLKKFQTIWSNIESNTFSSDFQDYKFFFGDQVLDNPKPHLRFKKYFKKEKELLIIVNKEKPKKLKRLLTIDNFSEDFIFEIQLLDIMRCRNRIRKVLLEIDFNLNCFKKQIETFVKDRVRIDSSLGLQGESKINNYFKAYISFEPLKLNLDVNLFNNWLKFLVNPRKTEDLFMILQFIMTLDSLMNTYITSNNLYYSALKAEFKNDLPKKIHESSFEYFRNVFDKKRINCFKILSNRRVSALVGKPEKREEAKTSNHLKNNLEKGQISIAIVEFRNLMDRDIYHEILKINTILIRNKLESLNFKLPARNKIFKNVKLKGLRAHEKAEKGKKSTIRINGKNSDQKDLETNPNGKNNEPINHTNGFFDEKGFASLLWILPSIEQIFSYSTDDLPKEYLPRIFPDVLMKEKEFSEKIMAARSDKNPNVSQSNVAEKKERKKFIPATRISFEKNLERRRIWDEKKFNYLAESSVRIMMDCLWHVYNILSLEIFTSSLELSENDYLYLNAGILSEEGFNEKKVEKETFDDFKRNTMRVSQKLEIVLDCVDNLDEKILHLQKKFTEKKELFNNELLKYLKMQHKKKFNLLLIGCFIQIFELRENNQLKDQEKDLNVFKKFLEEIAFKHINHFYNYKEEIIFLKKLSFQNVITKNTTSLYEEKSKLMTLIEDIFSLKHKANFLSQKNIVTFWNEENFNFQSVLTKKMLGVNYEKRMKFSHILKEINWCFYYLTHEEHPNESDLLTFEKKMYDIIRHHLKYFIMKEITYVARGENIGFDTFKNDFIDYITNKLKAISSSQRFYKSEKGRVLKLSEYVSTRNTIADKRDILSNEVEKAIIEQTINLYSVYNRVLGDFVNKTNYIIEGSSFKYNLLNQEKNEKNQECKVVSPTEKGRKSLILMIKTGTILNANSEKAPPQKLNNIFLDFYYRIHSNSVKIDIVREGCGLVLSNESFDESLSLLNLSLIKLCYNSFLFLLEPILKSMDCIYIEQKNNNSIFCDSTNKKNFLLTSNTELIESRLATKSNDLLFELDHSYKFLSYMKDEEMLREHEIKKIARLDFVESIRDSKINLQNIKNRFKDYKMGMTLDLKKYINEAKLETERIIKKKTEYRPSFINKFSFLFKKNLEEAIEKIEEKNVNENFETQILNDRSKLYKLFLKLRIFYGLKHAAMNQKITNEISQKNQNFISSDILWTKINELEIREASHKSGLIEVEKEMAILEHQNMNLKKSVREITLEKVKYYKSNNMQRAEIVELRENLNVVKRKNYSESLNMEKELRISNRPLTSTIKKRSLLDYISPPKAILPKTKVIEDEKEKLNDKYKGVNQFLNSRSEKIFVSISGKKNRDVLNSTGSFLQKKFRSDSKRSNMNFYYSDKKLE